MGNLLQFNIRPWSYTSEFSRKSPHDSVTSRKTPCCLSLNHYLKTQTWGELLSVFILKRNTMIFLYLLEINFIAHNHGIHIDSKGISGGIQPSSHRLTFQYFGVFVVKVTRNISLRRNSKHSMIYGSQSCWFVRLYTCHCSLWPSSTHTCHCSL